MTGEKIWNTDDDSHYSYEKIAEGLKSYKIGEKKTVAEFNNYEKEVISPVDGTDGTERFYVMALEDLDSSKHYWYEKAYGKLNNLEDSSEKVDFKNSDGKTNTKNMIKNWNSNGEDESYGSQNDDDLWGVIQNTNINKKYNLDKWFVPSRAEWSAFGDMLYTCEYLPEVVTKENFVKYNLKGLYWSSSQRNTDLAWYANFNYGYMSGHDANYYFYVRLSATY